MNTDFQKSQSNINRRSTSNRSTNVRETYSNPIESLTARLYSLQHDHQSSSSSSNKETVIQETNKDVCDGESRYHTNVQEEWLGRFVIDPKEEHNVVKDEPPDSPISQTMVDLKEALLFDIACALEREMHEYPRYNDDDDDDSIVVAKRRNLKKRGIKETER